MEICQDHLPHAPWAEPALRRLPGVKPLEAGDWLRVDEAYAAQMAERRRLLAVARGDVVVLEDHARPFAAELLTEVMGVLPDLGFKLKSGKVICPDGYEVGIEPELPLVTLGRLVQEDFCILERRGGEHVLVGAVLCFPASWSLAEKYGRPLVEIHEPVDSYDGGIAARVQRLFDGVKPGRGLWRANALFYTDPTLHQPRRMDARRVQPGQRAPYVRSERQTIIRLPQSGAVVFGIHTYQVRRENLTPDQLAGLDEHPIEQV